MKQIQICNVSYIESPRSRFWGLGFFYKIPGRRLLISGLLSTSLLGGCSYLPFKLVLEGRDFDVSGCFTVSLPSEGHLDASEAAVSDEICSQPPADDGSNTP